MNYKVTWNAAAHSWVAAAEPAKRRGKQSKFRKSAVAVALAMAIAMPFTATASETCELAEGKSGVLNNDGQCVVAPSAVTSMSSGSVMSSGYALATPSAALDDTYLKIHGSTESSLVDASGWGTTGSMAIGNAAKATSRDAIAIGSGAEANSHSSDGFNPSSIAIGRETKSGWFGLALGSESEATGAASTAIGRNTKALGDRSTAIGENAAATASYGIAVGHSAKVSAGSSVALGRNSNASASGAVALGYGSVADVANTVSVGSDTTHRRIVNMAAGVLAADSTDAVNGSQLFETNERVTAVEGDITTINDNLTTLDGRVTNIDSRVTNNEGAIDNIRNELDSGTVGLVQQDTATGNISVAAASGGSSVNFAGTDGARVLSGVANGVDDQDAATIAQLKASGLVDPNDGRALGALVYDDMSLDRATLGGTNGTVIGNVANGLVAVGSREAVNGGQLATIRDQLQQQIGNVSDRVDTIEEGIADGSIGGPGEGGPGEGGGGPIDDNGGRPISNVGDGVVDTDAATVGQVNKKYDQAVKDANSYTDTRFDQLQTDFNQRFDVMDSRIDRMGAMSSAMMNMGINAANSRSPRGRVGAGVGWQNGESALSVGYSKAVGERASFSLGGAFSGSERSIGAGFGIDL